MPEIKIDIDIYCATCGAGLCGGTSVSTRGSNPCFHVEPCERCLERAKDEGYHEGLAEREEEK